jgi:hypothetical protein
MTRQTFLFRSAIIAALFCLSACATTPGGKARRAVQQYLAAQTLDEASALLAPDYRIWFGERSGEGKDRAAALEMLRWDFALNPYRRLDELTVGDDGTVTIRVHEENDLSRLIAYPGWNATSTFTVNAQGLITSQLYVPDPGRPDWHPYLEPALVWLRANRPEALERVYPDGRVIQTGDTARQWVALLKAWRQSMAQTGSVR